MSLPIYGRALQHGRTADAVKWNVQPTITRAVGVAAAAIRAGCGIVVTIAGMLAIVVASLALDVWILGRAVGPLTSP
jgi:hypothetical protein